MAQKIDGKKLARDLREQIGEKVAALTKQGKRPPSLTVILVGENLASQVYVDNKRQACEEVGFQSKIERLPPDVGVDRLLEMVEQYNRDVKTDGILIQLPLPKQIASDIVMEKIDPRKDVDGLHPYNIGSLYSNRAGLRPCTPQAVMALIDSTGIDCGGKNAVVVGRSQIVGRPVAEMLTQENATVTLCGSRTQNLPEKIRGADILVAAIGKPEFIQGDWIKPGAVVIDVGINRLANGKLVGDVDFAAAQKIAGFISPVPGGVGPMTIAMLLKNTLEAYEKNTAV